MGYSIFQFDKEKLKGLMFGENAIKINCGDLGLLNEIVDKYFSLPKHQFDGLDYVWISYEVLMNDFPILSDNVGTYRNNCRKLEKLGLIDKIDKAHKVGKDCKKKTFFRPTELTLSLINGKNKAQNTTPEEVEEPSNTPEVEEVKPVDSNGDLPLNGQIHIEEVEELTPVQTIIKATGTTTERAEQVLSYAIENNKNNPIGFSIDAIKGNWSLSKKSNKPANKKTCFNNFDGRNQTEEYYNDLEKKLLGWD